MVKNKLKNNYFYWGAATAAFQIEGSPLADGAVASDWYKRYIEIDRKQTKGSLCIG